MVFNGKVKGDKEGEYTFTGGRGDTMIDYVLSDREREGWGSVIEEWV